MASWFSFAGRQRNQSLSLRFYFDWIISRKHLQRNTTQSGRYPQLETERKRENERERWILTQQVSEHRTKRHVYFFFVFFVEEKYIRFFFGSSSKHERKNKHKRQRIDFKFVADVIFNLLYCSFIWYHCLVVLALVVALDHYYHYHH